MTLENLRTIWFLLLFVLLIGYAILDGFDLGVGAIYLFLGKAKRRIALNAIGPVWDGNEVWLLTAGGALFAAFPPVYATVFSGLYIALMLLLVALIARAVAMEFRSKIESPAWQSVWDVAFALGSILPAVLLGVAFGNVLRGLPLMENHELSETFSFFSLLNPYSILVGVLTLVAFTVHGGIYLAGKADEELRGKLLKVVPKLHIALVVLYVVATAATVWVSPFLFAKVVESWLTWIFAVLALVGLWATGSLIRQGQTGYAFISSALSIGSMIALPAISLFPILVPSEVSLDYSLTIGNSSSTQGTLKVMFIIALIGMPLVLAYTAFVYRAFKGKVVLSEESY